MAEEYDHLLKLLLVGDTAVGKSSLLLRFTDGTFDTDLQSTIGVDFKVKLIRVGGKVVKATIVRAARLDLRPAALSAAR